jgi:hypothetical protein
VYCTHVDGGLSCWTRRPGELVFRLGPATKLVPPPSRGSSGAQASVVAVCCALWQEELLGDGGRGGVTGEIGRIPPPASTTQSIGRQLATSIGQNDSEEGGGRGARGSGASSSLDQHKVPSGSPFSGRALLVMAVSSDGRVWQWDVPVPKFPRKQFLTSMEDSTITAIGASIHQQQLTRSPPESVPPLLSGLLHGLPSGMLTFDVHPRPLLLPSMSAPAAAAAAAEAAAEAYSSQRNLAGVEPQIGRPTYVRREPTASATGGGVPMSPLASMAAAALQGLGSGAWGGAGQGGEGASVEAPREVVLGAAGTASGSIELFVIHRGLVNPLATEVGCRLAAYRSGFGICTQH